MFVARDGIDFVPGKRGYRRLTPEFVRERIVHCREQGLSYLAVHNHGGENHVAFSPVDNASHERSYPALLDIADQPVGALVFARNAAAGDIWMPDRRRREVDEVIVTGRNLDRLYPTPPPPPPKADLTYDRQVRWFGERSQALLGRLKVGVIGAGGVGLPIITILARLGVGELVVVDPDRVDPTNLPRLDATGLDAMLGLYRVPQLQWLAQRLATSKVRLARRSARRANPRIKMTTFKSGVTAAAPARALTDCDFLFLAADSHLARMLFNALVHQYLIPGIQLGTRIDVESDLGTVEEIRTNVRLVLPDIGCLRCNRLISAGKLQDEAIGRKERERNRYVDEVHAPSVITFNALAAAQATSDFLLMMGGLIEAGAPREYLRFRPRQRKLEPIVGLASEAGCGDCGLTARSRRARGDLVELPLPESRTPIGT